MIASALFLAASTLAAVKAQDVPTSASESQLKYVEAQYDDSGFNKALPSQSCFLMQKPARACVKFPRA